MAVNLPVTVMLESNEASEVLARHVMRKLGIEKVEGFGLKITPGRDGSWTVAVVLGATQ